MFVDVVCAEFLLHNSALLKLKEYTTTGAKYSEYNKEYVERSVQPDNVIRTLLSVVICSNSLMM